MVVLYINKSFFTFFVNKSLNSQICLGTVKRQAHRYVVPTLNEIRRRQKRAEPLPLEKSKRSNYIEWNYNAELFSFGKRLGEEFKIELLLQAFMHKSYLDEERLKQEKVGIKDTNIEVPHNESLARKGGKIISEISQNYLSRALPRFPLEGVHAVNNFLNSRESLGEISKNLGTKDIIFSADYPPEIETYSQTLKAIVGSLAESQSLDRAGLFVRDLIITTLYDKDVNEIFLINNPLNVVEEILRKDSHAKPEPRIIGQSAMNDLLANYHVGIYCDKQLLGHGPGETIDAAVEMASRDVLKRFFNTRDSCINFKLKPDFSTNLENLRLADWKLSSFN